MKRVTLIATALVLAVFAALAGGVTAQQTNTSERTFLTFSNTVEMPGLTLQPGTYVFKLADTASRNVVQAWNEAEDQILGQWLFVQAERSEVTSENVVMFRETSAGSTPAVQYWYFPGERIGKEFIYPKDQAMRIAAATGSSVLTGEGTEVSSIDARGNVTAWEKQQQARADATASDTPDAVASDRQGVVPGFPAATPDSSADSTLTTAPASSQPSAAAGSLAGNRGAQSEAVGTSAEAVGTSGARAESQVARADELPRTASPLALTGLIGLLSLAGALGLRAYRQ